LGLAHSLLHRLPDRVFHLRDPALAGRDAGLPRPEEAPDRVGDTAIDGGELADRVPGHEPRRAHHGDVHTVYTPTFGKTVLKLTEFDSLLVTGAASY
jgi:hypothetical protein